MERKRQTEVEEGGLFVREEIYGSRLMLNIGGFLCLNAVLPINILAAEMKAGLYNAHALFFLLTLQRIADISLWVFDSDVN